MKKIFLITLFSLIVILSLVTVAFAETAGLPGTGWWSGEQVQNVGNSSGNVYITAYDANSSNIYKSSYPLDPGEATTFLPWSFAGMPGGFQGSAVITSTVDIRAIANVTVRYIASQGAGDPLSPSPATGQYQGMNEPDEDIYFPLVKNDHFHKTTNFAIQNTGSGTATAYATFKLPSSPGGPITTYTFTTPPIAPNKMVIISPNDANAPSGDYIVGSLVVTSAQPLAGTAMEFITGEVHPTVLQTMRAFTASDFDNTYYAPIIKHKWFLRSTGIQVQNVSGGLINISIEYKGNILAAACANQTYSDSKVDLADGESWTFLSSAKLPENCLAAATITATGDILAIVNESYSIIPSGRYQEATSYNAFPGTKATQVTSIPLFKENSYGKKTGISVMNVGNGTATNVIAKFIGPTGTYVTEPQTVAKGGSLILLDVRNQPPSFWNGVAMTPVALGCAVPDNATGCGVNGLFGVIITADQPIVAIASESDTSKGYFLQDKNNYEGFNLLSDPTAP